MSVPEILRAKRLGQALSGADIREIVRGVADGSVSEGQIGAFTMAVCLNGMTAVECADLTLAMADSGTRIRWDKENLPGPCVDKHSTGGVGDKVSLMLAAMLAATGAFVPMISGRGLGHTGGTLDKLESIQGYKVVVDTTLLRRVTREAGCAIVGASAGLAPADAAMYAVRDVTATVESVPLITASILSKKLAAGVSSLVMDVKTGNGAFISELDEARELANSLVTVAAQAKLPVTAVITDMNEVLGTTAGNALEVFEAVEALRGEPCDSRLLDVTLVLGSQLLASIDAATTIREARHRLEQTLVDGSAFERFAKMVSALGGSLEDRFTPPPAPVVRDVEAPTTGFIGHMATRDVGLAVVALGGGRQRPGEKLDLSVGFDAIRKVGSAVTQGDPLARVHARTPAEAERATRAFLNAVTIVEDQPEERPVILDAVGPLT